MTLEQAAEALLSAYRAKYRRALGGVRANAPLQREVGELAIALAGQRQPETR